MEGLLIGFVAITDVERSRTFYTELLGLEFITDDGFALVLRSGTNMMRLVSMKEMTPAPFTILGWEVQDIDRSVRELTDTGVSFLRYPWFPQDAQGIWTSPNGDRVAWFADPDGNVLSLSQH